MHKPGRCTGTIEIVRQPGWRSRLVSVFDYWKDASRSERRAGAGAAEPNKADTNELWAEPLDRVMVRLGTSAAGLLGSEATRRLALHGPNDPAVTRRTPPWLQFLARFRNPLVIILLVASALSAAVGDATSFLIVVTIIALSTTLDFLQEFRAHNAVDALRHSVAVRAAVRRDGAVVSVPVDQIVPGDIVELSAGDLVPADGCLVESRDLFVNEALLTGEPYPAEKHAGGGPQCAAGCPRSLARETQEREAARKASGTPQRRSGPALSVVIEDGAATGECIDRETPYGLGGPADPQPLERNL